MRTSFRVSTFSKCHSLSSYSNISTVISKVLGVNFSAGNIRTYFPRVSKNLLKRNIGKENGQVRWSFFKEETEEFLATASKVLKASLNDPSNLTECNVYMLSENLKMICSQSLQRRQEVEICFDTTFPEQFQLFSNHHSPRLSNWTPWYNSENETIHLYSFHQTPGYADKEIILCKDGKWNFRSEGYDRNTSDVNVFVPLPEQIIRIKSLIKLLEIIDQCKMCNGCGLTEQFGHLISEGETLFKKKDGRDGIVLEKQTLRSSDCNILLDDDSDSCPSCKSCSHYLRTISSRKRKSSDKQASTSTRYDNRSKEELIATARESSKTSKTNLIK